MTIRQPMNELTVKRLKYDPKQGRFEYLDPPMHGHGTFGVRVNKTSKSFILLYSFHNHPRRLTLGKYPAMSLTEAREQAAGYALSATRAYLVAARLVDGTRAGLRADG